MSAKEDLFGKVPKTERVFIPHPECMVASGECLNLGRCLAKCKTRAFYEHQRDLNEMGYRMAQLERRILMLEKPELFKTQAGIEFEKKAGPL